MVELLQIIDDKNVDALLLTNANYRRYATGFLSSFGVYLLTREGQHLFTDARYIVSAKKICKHKNIDVHLVQNIEDVYAFLKERGYIKLALPLDVTFANALESLRNEQFIVLDCSKELSMAIAVKTDAELKKIKRACNITEKSLHAILPSLQVGVSELEIAGLLEYTMRKFGAENRAFDSIVAFAENTAIPHHSSSTKKLQKGMPVLLDFGAVYDGYAADMTRSFLFCPQQNSYTSFYLQMHKLVALAHQQAKSKVAVNCCAKDIDATARAVFSKYAIDCKQLKNLQKDKSIALNHLLIQPKEGMPSSNYTNLATYFTHALGHGVGVFIHQSPTLSKTSKDCLAKNTVFTIEPGLYFEGLFGIRIEDTLILQDKAKSFMQTKLNLSII